MRVSNGSRLLICHCPAFLCLNSRVVSGKGDAARKSPTGSNTMNIIRSSAMAALGFALVTGNVLAQTLTPAPPSNPLSAPVAPLQSQITSPLPPTGTTIIQPIPLTPPQLPAAASGFTSCAINCDTVAMNCQNSCIPTTAVTLANPAGAGSSGACNLSCSSQQLACKQRCGPGQ